MSSSEAVPLRRWARQAFSPLRNPTFRSIWLASLASNLGTNIQIVAAAWLMVSITDSPILIALVQTAATLPMMIFALLAGACADLFERRTQMIASLAFCTVAASLLFLLTFLDMISAPRLLLGTFLIGAGTAFFMPAWQASVIEIVRPSRLAQAVSLNSMSFNTARSLGPVIAAEILAVAGAATAFFVNAISYLGLIGALVTWKKPAVSRSLPRESLGRAMADGLRFVGLSPSVRRLMYRGFVFAIGSASLMSLPPLIAVEIGGGPRTLGALVGGFGVGAFLGAMQTARLRMSISADRLQSGAAGLIAVSMLVLAASRSLVICTGAMVVAGACWTWSMATLNVAVQTSCPRWVAGRSLSIYMMTFFFGIASGSAISGVTADHLDVTTALLISAAVLGLTVLLAPLMPIAEVQSQSLEPQHDVSKRSALDIDPRAGPVVVSIDYRVPTVNANAFMDAMYAIQRVRRRDGARRWSLTQDVDDLELWQERFHSPTWTDYLHRTSRKLTADREIYEQVNQLCSEKPIRHVRLGRPAGASPLERS